MITALHILASTYSFAQLPLPFAMTEFTILTWPEKAGRFSFTFSDPLTDHGTEGDAPRHELVQILAGATSRSGSRIPFLEKLMGLRTTAAFWISSLLQHGVANDIATLSHHD